MITYTVDDIMVEGPCPYYTRERVEELWAGRESITPREIASLSISTDNKIWALSRLLWSLSPYRAFKCARLFALEVADLWDCPDNALWYLASGDDSALARSMASASARASAMSMASARSMASASARASVWASFRAKSSAMAKSGAKSGVWYSARASARARASASARASAMSMASVMAWDAARDAALERHLEILVGAFEVTR